MKYILMFASLLAITLSAQGNTCVLEDRDSSTVDSVASVNNSSIGKQEFVISLQLAAREQFYHFEAPEVQHDSFRTEIIDDLIANRLLALHAINRYGMTTDNNKIDQLKAQLMDQFSDDERFEDNQNQILNFYICREERKQLISQLKAKIYKNINLSNAEIKQYYEENPDKFTSPVQSNIALILIGVEAGMPQETWTEAKNLATQLHLMLQEGADFSELAKKHSSDISARHGGDMGYQHEGMLGEDIEELLSNMATGQLSEPVFLLEGWALVKLLGRQQPTLNPYKIVKERAKGLLLKEQRELTWDDLIQSLKNAATLEVNEEAIKKL